MAWLAKMFCMVGYRTMKGWCIVLSILMTISVLAVITASIWGAIEIAPDVESYLVETEIDGETHLSREEDITYGALSKGSTITLAAGFGAGIVSTIFSKMLSNEVRRRSDNIRSHTYAERRQLPLGAPSFKNSDREEMQEKMQYSNWKWFGFFALMGGLYALALLSGYGWVPLGDFLECFAPLLTTLASIACGVIAICLIFDHGFDYSQFISSKKSKWYDHNEPQQGSPNAVRTAELAQERVLRAQQRALRQGARMPPPNGNHGQNLGPAEAQDESDSELSVSSTLKQGEEICAICLSKTRPEQHPFSNFTCGEQSHRVHTGCRGGWPGGCPTCRAP